MTSNRGQNVFILQQTTAEPWEGSITAFADTETSLRSAIPSRNNSMRYDRNRVLKTQNYENKKCSNSLITNSVSSSSISHQVGRELSPVRWCDRKVDGVFLGKSGWVQVQHRSLEDTEGFREVNNGVSTLPLRKNFSESNSKTRSFDRGERRPMNLPIKKRTSQENHERPCKFIQELDTVSPPSVTPIISPPPAFKDNSLFVEFPRSSAQKSFSAKKYESSPSPSPDRQSVLSSEWTGSMSRSNIKNHRSIYQSLHAKSLEDDKIRSIKGLNPTPFARFNFRSLDNEIKQSNAYTAFEDAGKKRAGELEQKENIDSERLLHDGIKFSKSRHRNYQRDGKRDFIKAYRTRSSSNSSNSSDTSGSSFNEKNSEKTTKSFDFEEKNKFYVKRSRSLQLSEKKSPVELNNHASAGKSCDPLFPECALPQLPQRAHHMLVTVDGESIPVFASCNQSLSKIATSELKQKKLLKEAEKEAKIISDYLNGTRSRAAARNLLMHRYFNQSENFQEKTTRDRDALYADQKSKNYSYYHTPAVRKPSTVYFQTPENEILCENSPNRRNLEQNSNHRADYKKQNRWDHKNMKQQFPPKVYEEQVSKTHYSSVSSSPSSSSSSSSSFDDVFQCPPGNIPGFYQNSNSQTSPGSAPEVEDGILTSANHRSLSLPRSFLSKQCGKNQTRWKPESAETPTVAKNESAMSLLGSRTAPTTPVREMRCDRSCENLNVTERNESPTTSLYSESSVLKPHGIIQKGKIGVSAVNVNENAFLSFKKLPKHPVLDSGTVAKNFPSRVSRTQEYNNGQETKTDNSRVIHSFGSGLPSSLGFFGNNYEYQQQTLGHTKSHMRDKISMKSEKYDSHDSGIQMGNRGNVESSESQDTDFQEEFDSPLAVRRRDFRFNCRPQSEVYNQILIDKLKADLQWRNKSEKFYGKGVRRTNSDLGGQRLYNWDFKNHNKRFFNSSSIKDTGAEGGWRHVNSPDSDTSGRLLKPRLRRSISQPLGLNELPSFVRRRSSTLKYLALSEDEKHPCKRNSEDELLSDSESSVISLSERKKSMDFARRDETAILAEAVWDHVAMEPFELPFRAGDVIEVLNTRDRDWWWGAAGENIGYFPSAFVRLRVSQEDTVEDYLAAVAKGKHTLTQHRLGKSVSLLSNDQVRSSIVKELLSTERDFVKILRNVRDGYIIQCKRRAEMFNSAQIKAIFSNLEDLLVFQEKFLKDLEAKVDQSVPHKSCIGDVFLNHSSGFRMYSEYCNAHPVAIATLQDLYQKNNYCKFFETCRLKQNLMEIPLDGYLLTPVQRICKYPLQLAELLKYTKLDHPDYKKVEEALETMRSVANLINERKRKMESLEKLAAWQQRVEGWEGEDLIEISSQLIHQGEVVRVTSGMWTNNVTLFLFDHQIIYCKKDMLKKNVYVYKGRIYLDASIVVDLPDGKNQQLGVTVKYGLQISSSLNDKWLVFCCRSNDDKAMWLQALTEERRIVAQDKEVGLDLPPAAKQLAKIAAKTKKCPPCKPRGKNKLGSSRETIFSRNNHPDSSKPKSSRKVGAWFTFGGVMKSSKVSLRPRAYPHRIT